MSKNTIIGIDLVKTVFQVATMPDNNIKSNKRINRKEFRLFLSNQALNVRCKNMSLSLSASQTSKANSGIKLNKAITLKYCTPCPE